MHHAKFLVLVKTEKTQRRKLKANEKILFACWFQIITWKNWWNVYSKYIFLFILYYIKLLKSKLKRLSCQGFQQQSKRFLFNYFYEFISNFAVHMKIICNIKSLKKMYKMGN